MQGPLPHDSFQILGACCSCASRKGSNAQVDLGQRCTSRRYLESPSYTGTVRRLARGRLNALVFLRRYIRNVSVT